MISDAPLHVNTYVQLLTFVYLKKKIREYENDIIRLVSYFKTKVSWVIYIHFHGRQSYAIKYSEYHGCDDPVMHVAWASGEMVYT